MTRKIVKRSKFFFNSLIYNQINHHSILFDQTQNKRTFHNYPNYMNSNFKILISLLNFLFKNNSLILTKFNGPVFELLFCFNRNFGLKSFFYGRTFGMNY